MITAWWGGEIIAKQDEKESTEKQEEEIASDTIKSKLLNDKNGASYNKQNFEIHLPHAPCKTQTNMNLIWSRLRNGLVYFRFS